VGKGAKRRAHAFLFDATAWASLRSAHPTKLTGWEQTDCSYHVAAQAQVDRPAKV